MKQEIIQTHVILKFLKTSDEEKNLNIAKGQKDILSTYNQK